ncbi:MAG: DNA translocase FtsK [Clostridia bacterium]|nr:DNA translocase FtsK [Clostridia bacterium]
MGYLGYLGALLRGFFSFGAYLVPVCLVLHAVFYKRDLQAGSYLYKFWFSFGDMTFLGVLSALLAGKEPSFAFAENYAAGLDFTGGGLIGGLMYAILKKTVGVFTPVITVLALVIFTTFLFGKTPVDLVKSVIVPWGERLREGREERLDRQAEDREAREAERIRLAEERAKEKYRVREEMREEKRRKKEKCPANLESGEPVTEASYEDHIPDDEVEIRLTENDPRDLEEPEEVREFTPIEDIESEPVPVVHSEILEIFEENDDPAKAEKEIREKLSEKYGDEFYQDKEEIAIGEEIKEEPLYHFPPLSLLQSAPPAAAASASEQEQTAKKLVDTLASFGVKTSVCGIAKGPAVTRYELQPQPGVRVRSIVNLTDDIALALAAGGIRIEAPIPGKEAVGIEVPNRARETVFVRELIEKSEFMENPSRLNCSLGKDVAGKAVYCDLSKMPHILIAGATGMGKSVCLNSLIISILYHATPEEVQMILIDPKKVEMGMYNGIPHLLVPVVSDSKKAAGALNWAVIEMEKRFIEMEEVGVRDIKHYNEITANDPEKRRMTHIVIIIDELADLMMTARDEVETSICRLAQKARAAGMHLVIGTQRPSVDVITGLIKANVPSRIACTVASQVDSRTIIDIQGAEKLMGRGDMLYAPVGVSKPLRVQGSFVSEKEIESVCDFIRSQRTAHYDEAVSNLIEREAQKCGEKKKGGFFSSEEEGAAGSVGLFADKDPLLEKAIDIAIAEKKVSTSLLQRKLSVGYARAAKLIDMMAEMHVVGEYAGSKPREVLWSDSYWAEYKMKALEDAPID